MEFVGNATPLGPEDIVLEAQKLGCEPAAIWAVCDVESSGSGFLPDNRPKILFEAHSFHTLTHGAYDRSHPNISSPYWNRTLYGASGAHQYDRLGVAIELDREAALESASWGKFQIMGSNFHITGFSDVESFVAAMMDDEANHLIAFGNFCNSVGITRDLIAHDWTHFALRYNGPGNVQNYARKLADAYRHRSAIIPTPSPLPQPETLRIGDKGVAVLALQTQLVQLGFPIRPDGIFGKQTESAVKVVQQQFNLEVDGVVGSKTRAMIEKAIV